MQPVAQKTIDPSKCISNLCIAVGRLLGKCCTACHLGIGFALNLCLSMSAEAYVGQCNELDVVSDLLLAVVGRPVVKQGADIPRNARSLLGLVNRLGTCGH